MYLKEVIVARMLVCMRLRGFMYPEQVYPQWLRGHSICLVLVHTAGWDLGGFSFTCGPLRVIF